MLKHLPNGAKCKCKCRKSTTLLIGPLLICPDFFPRCDRPITRRFRGLFVPKPIAYPGPHKSQVSIGPSPIPPQTTKRLFSYFDDFTLSCPTPPSASLYRIAAKSSTSLSAGPETSCFVYIASIGCLLRLDVAVSAAMDGPLRVASLLFNDRKVLFPHDSITLAKVISNLPNCNIKIQNFLLT